MATQLVVPFWTRPVPRVVLNEDQRQNASSKMQQTDGQSNPNSKLPQADEKLKNQLNNYDKRCDKLVGREAVASAEPRFCLESRRNRQDQHAKVAIASLESRASLPQNIRFLWKELVQHNV